MGLILIADDNPHAHRMGRQILSQEGHDVVTVATGDEAMDYLRENRPQLVMADTRMPGPSGYEICSHVKQSDNLQGVRVVLLAGPLEPFDSNQAEQCGSDAVLHKPLDAFTLIDTVNSLIGKPDPAAASMENRPSQNASAERPAETDTDDRDSRLSNDTWNGAEAPAAPEDLERARQEVAVSTASVVAEPRVHEAVSALSPSSDDPFAAVVREALSPGDSEEERREKVRTAVTEILQAALPKLVDEITDRVAEKLKQD